MGNSSTVLTLEMAAESEHHAPSNIMPHGSLIRCHERPDDTTLAGLLTCCLEDADGVDNDDVDGTISYRHTGQDECFDSHASKHVEWNT